MSIPRIFWVSVVLTGALVGLLVGASKSPLASAALPIIAALLTAAAAYLFATGKGNRSVVPYRIAGLGFLCLFAGFLPAFVVGIILRIGPVEYLAVGPWVLDWGKTDPFSGLKTTDQQRKYLVLSSHLSALGIDAHHRRAYLGSLVAANKQRRADLLTILSDAARMRIILGALDKLANCGDLADRDRLAISFSRRVWQDLRLDAERPKDAVPPTCGVMCKPGLLAGSLQYWNAPLLLHDKALDCGLAAEELAGLTTALDSALSPLDRAYLAAHADSQSFHAIWDTASGEFTGKGDITEVIGTLTNEDDR